MTNLNINFKKMLKEKIQRCQNNNSWISLCDNSWNINANVADKFS